MNHRIEIDDNNNQLSDVSSNFKKSQSINDLESGTSPRANPSLEVAASLNKLLILSNPNLRKSQPLDANGSSVKSEPHSQLQSPTIEDPLQVNLVLPSANPSPSGIENNKRLHRVVLTGGPCAGKTTSINRIKNFFENIGWKAFCVPETATCLLSSGIYFYDLESHTMDFQENLLKTLLQIEDTITDVARYYHSERGQNCIVIYDRGAMDPLAYLDEKDWEMLKQRNPTWNEVDLRDNRYDQIIHLVTAANGAEKFYILDNNVARTEGIEQARKVDKRCAKAWVGHPYFDMIDNCTEFEMKIARVLQAVCNRIGLQLTGFDIGSKKRKFLVKNVPDNSLFPAYQDFNVIHNYLVSNSENMQARIRKRGQSNVWSYTYTVRIKQDTQTVETRRQIDKREYAMLLKTVDSNHFTIYKLRRCFEWSHHYYQLDMYEEPCNPICRGLSILTTHSLEDNVELPDFLEIEKEITNDPEYSMYNLSLKSK